jgi:hypothetical protein
VAAGRRGRKALDSGLVVAQPSWPRRATSGLMRRKISSSHCRVGVENESAADILFAFGPELELKEGVEYDRMPLPSLEL